ncbi:MAG: 4Fe-4S dicluster domain-containing protein [Thermodesulfovibrionia bacterium]
MQLAWYFDQSRCQGCNTCVVACKDWNDVKPGPARWRRLTVKENGEFPKVSVLNLVLSCNHCKNPVCVKVCPVNAIYKRDEDGIVLVDRSRCRNIRACLAKCPFGAPQFGDNKSEPVKDPSWQVPHPMQKCTFCLDRWKTGKKPVCVDSCPQRALDAGPINEITARYPDAAEAVHGFPDSGRDPSGKPLLTGYTFPAIFFKPKTPGKPEVK